MKYRDEVVLAVGGAHVGERLHLGGVGIQVRVLRVLPEDHARVHLRAVVCAHQIDLRTITSQKY